MMLKLSLEYTALVFLAIVGVLQIAAICGHLSKLLFFSKKAHGYILAGLLILPAMVVFFTWNYYNPTGIIQGAEQAGLFMVSLVLALIVTLGFSSILNHSRAAAPRTHKEGVDALREVTYFQAFDRSSERKSR
jgi:hypothetical protein